MDIFAYLVHKRSLIDIISSFFLFFFSLHHSKRFFIMCVYLQRPIIDPNARRKREREAERKRGIINRFRFRVRSCKMQSARDVAKLTFNFALDGLE